MSLVCTVTRCIQLLCRVVGMPVAVHSLMFSVLFVYIGGHVTDCASETAENISDDGRQSATRINNNNKIFVREKRLL